MATSPDRGRSTRSVFFVDDEPNILSALRRSLADEPYDMQTFLDPHELLERVAAERPPVVVSDFYMPAMKGPEVLKKVGEIDPYIVRMILTGQPDLGVFLSPFQGLHVPTIGGFRVFANGAAGRFIRRIVVAGDRQRRFRISRVGCILHQKKRRIARTE